MAGTATRTLPALLAPVAAALLLGACDGVVHLCGQYACVYYNNVCNSEHCTAERRCESEASIRDRLPAIVIELRQARRHCSAAAGLADNRAIELDWNAELATVATLHARDMAQHGFQSFTGTDGSGTRERLLAADIEFVQHGESIGSGPQTIAAMLNNWLDTQTDCEQLLDRDLKRIAAACAMPSEHEQGPYWSLLLTD